MVVVLQTAAPRFDGPVESVLTDLAKFTACWLVGLAHQDRRLRRLSLPALLGLAALCLGVAVGWLVTHPDAGRDLNDIPVAQAFWPLGFVLVLLRVAPPRGWRLGQVGYLAVALVLLTGLVLALGWVEDLSARRPPRLLPWPRRTAARLPVARPATAEGEATAVRR